MRSERCENSLHALPPDTHVIPSPMFALHMTQKERVCRWSDKCNLFERTTCHGGHAFLKALKRGSPSALGRLMSGPRFSTLLMCPTYLMTSHALAKRISQVSVR